ncbi:MAG: alanine racemase [Candidatus Cloacimonetes bacterium]|nr:alanine racemase [Candidatus Cloacimonadota bacterium]
MIKNFQKLKIKKPTLVIDESKVRQNIQFMTEKANRNNLIFRPHFKTHQSAEIGEWFRKNGIDSITVSSVQMAEYFAKNGWKDITIAFPVNLMEIKEINVLAKKIALNILICDIETVESIEKKVTSKLGFFIKIDTGYHRTGFLIKDISQIEKILSIVKSNKNLQFKGFLTHAGNTYSTQSVSEISKIHTQNLELMSKLKNHFIGDYPNIICSIGDTPSCSLMENFIGIDEIRPGNFAFYDLMQFKLGSCIKGNISIAVYCPIVSKNSDRNEIVIYGGAVHLSKEYLLDEKNNQYFGEVAIPEKSGWIFPEQPIKVTKLTQEHGIFQISPEQLKTFKIGDIVAILPIHSCLTANLYKEYHTLSGDKIQRFY